MAVTKNFIFLCDRAFPDADGRLNAIGLFNRVTGEGLPAHKNGFFLVANFKTSDRGAKEVNVFSKRPNEVERFITKKTIIPKDGELGFGYVLGIKSLTLKDEGEYVFIVRVDGEEASTSFTFDISSELSTTSTNDNDRQTTRAKVPAE